MNTSTYLIISNVLTAFTLIMTCGIAIWRRRIIQCPFCDQRISDLDLRNHIQLCSEHNALYMGRFSPSIEPVPLQAIPVPLPLTPPVLPDPNVKVADL